MEVPPAPVPVLVLALVLVLVFTRLDQRERSSLLQLHPPHPHHLRKYSIQHLT
jgi:hypothetical protein